MNKLSSPERARRLSPPGEWPGPGPIDLELHDLPHAGATLEWWYLHGHLRTAEGREFSLFTAFFRVDLSDQEAGAERSDRHFLHWALVDVATGRYLATGVLDPATAGDAVDEMDAGRGPRDAAFARALREVLEEGELPGPERAQGTPPRIATDRLDLDLDGNRLWKRDGGYELTLRGSHAAVELRFELEKPVVRHGDDGVVRGVAGREMFYYFAPRCRVGGRVRVDDSWQPVTGSGWYDHEFGEPRGAAAHRSNEVGWNWVAAQLADGWEVSAYDLFHRDSAEGRGRWLIVIDPTGVARSFEEFSLEPLAHWTSARTFVEYPTRWRLASRAAGLDLEIEAELPHQEFLTVLAPPAYWEGRVRVRGRRGGREVHGLGFVERAGLEAPEDVDGFLSAVSRETQRAVVALLPDPPDQRALTALVGGGRPDLVAGVDGEQYGRTVLRPVREILLRGGKAWRSYGLLACIDAVGGDPQRFTHFLALPELLHVGSLIVDDVQDRSLTRRGGPACHVLFGEPLAINAGCAAYFLAELPLAEAGLDDRLRLQIYDAYFAALRGAHAGQALDIDSLRHLVPAALRDGDFAGLEARVLAIHRLKSAVPVGALARTGALLGGGSEAQVAGLGRLFEAFGLAFQVIDDVLNLRGFEHDRKPRGEDLALGKITAPVARAFALLAPADRERLWALLAQPPLDAGQVAEALQLVTGSGALAACEDEARSRIEAAWQAVCPLIPRSLARVRLRAFGWFVLDRHY